MRIFRGQPLIPFLGDTTQPQALASAVTIGNFDGLHLGHQAMIKRLLQVAQAQGLSSCVLTFEPHPRDYFAAQVPSLGVVPARVAGLRDKLSILAAWGVEQALVLPFRQALASLSPKAFVEQVLIQRLDARYVLVGDDFRFGAKRAGDFATLVELGIKSGFVSEQMPSIAVAGERASSSRVRQALMQGDMQTARHLLGRLYSMSGHVVHGRKLGRKLGQSADKPLGLSTLNIRFKHRQPAVSGVFAVRVHGLESQALDGVASLGTRPSLASNDVNGGRVLLETYCLDWPERLGQDGAYGKVLRIEFLHKLRDERHYTNLSTLQEGIEQDIATVRAFFACYPTQPSILTGLE